MAVKHKATNKKTASKAVKGKQYGRARQTGAPKSRTGVIIGVCAAVLALVLLGVFVLPELLDGRYELRDENDPVATIKLKNGKKIIVELYPDKAPNTVANFIELANSGFYDKLSFHRVISGFMIQGGDPLGNGTGGPGYSIKGEFSENGFAQNDLKHERGVISMARSQPFNSAGSQFFIMHADASYLDGSYAAFGKVVKGMDAVDAIASAKTGANDRPVEEQLIKSIRVDTKDVEYAAEKIR